MREINLQVITRKIKRLTLPLGGLALLAACQVKEPSSTLLTEKSTEIRQTGHQVSIAGPDDDEVEKARKIVVVDCRGRDLDGNPNFRKLAVDDISECLVLLKSRALRGNILSN